METDMSWFNKGSLAEGGNEDFLRAKIVDQVSVAIMTVDRDFMVTYVNQPTRDLLSKNAEAFRSIWPNFDPERSSARASTRFTGIRRINGKFFRTQKISRSVPRSRLAI